MHDPQEYRVSLQLRETEDGTLVEATVAELPDVAVYASDPTEAYETVLDVIEGLRDRATQQGKMFPQPEFREREYSGKFVVRLPKRLHRSLAETAHDQAVSLNQYVLSVLSCHNSWQNKVSESIVPVSMHELSALEPGILQWRSTDVDSETEDTASSGSSTLIANFGAVV